MVNFELFTFTPVRMRRDGARSTAGEDIAH
jgi:hypothetical protein